MKTRESMPLRARGRLGQCTVADTGCASPPVLIMVAGEGGIARRLGLAMAFMAHVVGCSGGNPGGSNGPSDECGNGVIDGSEECDHGRHNNDTAGCKTDCTNQMCGDGFVGPDEACDDGNDIEGDGCEPDCTKTDFCGNGQPDPGEGCDDGNDIDTDACLVGCIPATCGDGIVRAGVSDPRMPGYEECDDGNRNSDFAPDTCRANCRLPRCGDGVIDSNEKCDNGALNSDTEPNACRRDCMVPGCGDGVEDAGEACDDGDQNSNDRPDACRMGCVQARCGDGVKDSNEDCDDAGDSPDCNADCTPSDCGDGYTNQAAGEECDDSIETETCDLDCTAVECGDGYVNLAAGEECDSQDVVANGVCSVGCQVACAGFWQNCNGVPEDGCERDLQNDGRHCGECGVSCGGGACVRGECQPVKIADLAEIPIVSDLAVHRGRLYATTMAGIETVLADAESVTATTLLHGSRTLSRTLTIEGEELYFVGMMVPETGLSGLHSVNIDTGAVTFVSNHGSLATGTDGQHLYFVSPGAPATLVRYSYSSGTVEVVGNLPSSSADPGIDIIVEETVVFCVDMAGGPLWRFNKNPADPEPVPVTTPELAIDAESDATHLYWAEPNNNTVFRINKDPYGCLPSPVCGAESFATSAARPWALAVDDTHVYWVAIETLDAPMETARLERRAKSGDVEQIVVVDLAVPPTAIAEAGDFVYWVVGDEVTAGELWKLRKPR